MEPGKGMSKYFAILGNEEDVLEVKKSLTFSESDFEITQKERGTIEIPFSDKDGAGLHSTLLKIGKALVDSGMEKKVAVGVYDRYESDLKNPFQVEFGNGTNITLMSLDSEQTKEISIAEYLVVTNPLLHKRGQYSQWESWNIPELCTNGLKILSDYNPKINTLSKELSISPEDLSEIVADLDSVNDGKVIINDHEVDFTHIVSYSTKQKKIVRERNGNIKDFRVPVPNTSSRDHKILFNSLMYKFEENGKGHEIFVNYKGKNYHARLMEDKITLNPMNESEGGIELKP